jgi:uncharacterized protein YcgL (UPF0745 family)
MYLYLKDEEGFHHLPEPLLQRFGSPALVMKLELNEKRKLAREDVCKVMRNLQSQGFHLQMPPEVSATLYQGE